MSEESVCLDTEKCQEDARIRESFVFFVLYQQPALACVVSFALSNRTYVLTPEDVERIGHPPQAGLGLIDCT